MTRERAAWMTDQRAATLALVLSVLLHAGVVASVRGLGLVAPPDEPRPLVVDLVEPVLGGRPTAPGVQSEAPPAGRRGGVADRGAPVQSPRTIAPLTAPPRSSSRAAPLRRRLPGRPRAGPDRAPPRPDGDPSPRGAPTAISIPPAPPLVLDDRASAPRPSPRAVMVVRGPEPVARPAPGPRDDATPEPTRAAVPSLGAMARPRTPARSPAPKGIPGAGDGGLGDRAETMNRPGVVPGAPGGPSGEGTAEGSAPVALADPRSALPAEYHAYVRAFRRRIQGRLVYPRRAVRRGLEGTIELMVELDQSGRLSEVAVLSGEAPELREAAVRAVHAATPFPAPSRLGGHGLRIRLPVVFRLE